MASKAPSAIFREITTIRYLVGVYELHVRRGTARGRDGLAPAALSDEISDLCRRASGRIRSGRHEFTQYRERLMLKGQGKTPRVLSIPTSRDRIVLRALADLLKQVYPEAAGVIPQVRVAEVHAALQEQKFDSYVRLDVKDFYPSISHSRVRSALTARIKKKEIVQIVLDAIKTPTVSDRAKKRPERSNCGVPQGLAISNVLAELMAAPIDVAMNETSKWMYFRYVDDVLVLCGRRDVAEVSEKLITLFGQQGFEVHDPRKPGSKSSVGRVAAGFDFLGYVFSGRKISVRQESVYKVESRLARAFTKFKKTYKADADNLALNRCEWFANLAITGCIYNGYARGWLPYFRQMNDLRMLKQLDVSVTRFRRRFEMPNRFRTKSFMRAYWAINHPGGSHAGYIPNYDQMSVEDKRLVLINVFDGAKAIAMTDDEVTDRFGAIVDKAVNDMERDIGSIS